MRGVFVFPALERAQTVALLDRHLPNRREPWVMDECLYIDFDDVADGLLFSDWEPEDVEVLEAVTGHRPTWALQVDVSGRVDGTAAIHRLTALLLRDGGTAVDDYSAHPWTLAEITSGAVVDGLRFFDFRTHHAREHC